MIVNMMAVLAVIGLVAEGFQKNRLQRIWAFVLWGGFMAAVVPFIIGNGVVKSGKLVYHWIVSPVINVDISLALSADGRIILCSVLFTAAVCLFYNIFYAQEKERLRTGGLYILLVVAMAFFIASGNILQMLIGACVTDVLGFYLIRDTAAKQKYVFYNLLADMVLMAALALLWKKTGSLDFAAVEKFAKSGGSVSLTAGFVLFAAAVKSGVFPFHNSLLDLKRINIIRPMFIVLAATPLAGAVILFKFRGLLSFVPWVSQAEAVFAGMTFVWAFVGALVNNNIYAKILYLDMFMYGLLFGVLSENSSAFPVVLFAAAPSATVAVIALLLPVCAASNEMRVSGMGQFYRLMKFTLFLTLAAIVAGIPVWMQTAGNPAGMWGYAYLAALLVVLAHVLGQIYLGAGQADDRVWAMLKNPGLFYVLPLAAAAVLPYVGRVVWSWQAWAAAACFPVLFFLRPLRFLDGIYANGTVQEAEPVMSVYNMLLVAPVMIFARALWLMVDFLLIERTFFNKLDNITNVFVRMTLRMHEKVHVSGIVFAAAGFAAAVVCYYQWGGK